MFGWCRDNDLLDENQQNPAQGVKKPGVEHVRDRVLSNVELALVWHAAGALPSPWGPWARLLLLTGQRRSEVAGMRWEDVDLAEATWSLRARQTKSRRAHVVPLSPKALDLLAQMPCDCPWVFTTDTSTSIKGFSHAKRLIDTWLADRVETVAPWDWHDLRRTCNAGMARLKVLPHVREAVLNHAKQSVNERHYNPYDYDEEKGEALVKWAQHVAAVAERYRPAPTERELHQQKLLNAVRASKRKTKSRQEAEAEAVAALTGAGLT
jgi:integrase